MIVKEIVEVSKAKVKIVLDNEFSFVLYKGELRVYKLYNGCELSDTVFDEIINTVLVKRAKLRAMHLLEKRDYTEYKLREKLRQSDYPDSVIDKAIEYVCSYGYINDIKYASSYINYASNTKSRKQIEQDLCAKGISKDNIIIAFDSIESDIDHDEELIKRLLVKKHYNFENSSYEERRKIIGFLYRKGFNLDKIYKVLNFETELFDT